MRSWALKYCKLLNGTQLQFVINERLNTNILSNFLKEVFVKPISTRGERINPKKYWPMLSTPRWKKNFWKTSPGTDDTTFGNKKKQNQFGFKEEQSYLDTIIDPTEKVKPYAEEKT